MASESFLQVLRGSAPYIHSHHGATMVVAFGGEAAAQQHFAHLIYDLALLHSMGVRLVLVHGARPQIEHSLQQAGLSSRIEQGLRVTDATTLACVKQAAGVLRMEIEALLSTSLASTPMGGARLDVASGNLVVAKPVGVRHGVDHLYTGAVRHIDVEALDALLSRGSVVLLSPIGYSPTGEIFNLSYAEVATQAAIALQADKLLLLHDGQRLTQQLPGCPAQMALTELPHWQQQAEPELANLLHSAATACQHGVRRAHLVSHCEDGALLQELYSRDGAGTLIAAQNYDRLRSARLEDIGGLLELLEPLEHSGTLVPRGRERLELDLEYFLVMERDGCITACCALIPLPDVGGCAADTGEIACVAVHPDYRKQGRAAALLQAAEQRARELGLQRLFALTTHTAHWFVEHGFTAVDVEVLPAARRQLYNLQRNSKVFEKPLSA